MWKCSGAAGPFFSTRSVPSREVLNDANGNLINLYRVVREHPEELKDRLLYVLQQPGGLQNCPAAAGPILLQRRYPAGGGFLPSRPPKLRRQREAVQCRGPEYVGGIPRHRPSRRQAPGRHPGKEDFGVIFQRYDSPNTHFYIDPPYVYTEDYYPGNIFLRSDHQRLATILLNVEGLWLLSYNLCPEVLELYQQPGIFIEQVDRINNMAQRYEGGAVYQEVLISNYDTRKSAQAQLYLFEPAAEERKILWNGLY